METNTNVQTPLCYLPIRQSCRHGNVLNKLRFALALIASYSPIDKDQLFSGEWSIIIISNNGDAQPIAYERDFSLTVGPQNTTTYTPTVTVSVTTTPIVNSTMVVTDTDSSTLPQSTVTEP